MSLKKIAMFVPLLAALALAGCMTPQVELRMEYDKLVKAITAPVTTAEEAAVKRDEFLSPADGGAKAVLEYIWAVAAQTKAAVEGFQGKTQDEIKAINPMFMLMQSVPKDGQSQSAAEFPYYVKDVKVSLMTFGFAVKKDANNDSKEADAHFMLSVTGTAANKDGNVLKDANKKDITYTSMVILLNMSPDIPAPVINLHKYRISKDSDEIPVYNLIFTYAKTNGEWKITGVKDSGKDALSVEEIMNLRK